ncbi:alpha-ketoglutarate permease domain protein [Burkholderia pseudomallei]|nr:alpha-ketoglutarate permease domain protein [Burkholderia pseudomallei]
MFRLFRFPSTAPPLTLAEPDRAPSSGVGIRTRVMKTIETGDITCRKSALLLLPPIARRPAPSPAFVRSSADRSAI